MLKRSEFSADDLLYIHYFGRAHAHLGLVCRIIERGEFHIPHDASRLIEVERAFEGFEGDFQRPELTI